MKQLKEREGFFLIEALLSLFILMIVCSFLLGFMKVYVHYKPDVTALTPLSFHTILTRIQNELLKGREVEMEREALRFLTNEQKQISYSLKNNKLIRQVDKKGTEVLMFQVQELHISLQSKEIIEIKLTSLEGKIFTGFLFISQLGDDRDE